MSPDRMEKCYVHNGTNPTRSIVATCYDGSGKTVGHFGKLNAGARRLAGSIRCGAAAGDWSAST
jgi:hypothetical protein